MSATNQPDYYKEYIVPIIIRTDFTIEADSPEHAAEIAQKAWRQWKDTVDNHYDHRCRNSCWGHKIASGPVEIDREGIERDYTSQWASEEEEAD